MIKVMYGGGVLIDLSKTFDTLNHDLLRAKLSAYRFEHDALKFIFSYLTNRWDRTKINSAFSSWKELHKRFTKVLFLVLFYLISSSMTYFTFLNVQKRVTLLMLQVFTLTIKVLVLLLVD